MNSGKSFYVQMQIRSGRKTVFRLHDEERTTKAGTRWQFLKNSLEILQIFNLFHNNFVLYFKWFSIKLKFIHGLCKKFSLNFGLLELLLRFDSADVSWIWCQILKFSVTFECTFMWFSCKIKYLPFCACFVGTGLLQRAHCRTVSTCENCNWRISRGHVSSQSVHE